MNGDVYGLPYDFGPYIIYYNKDLFDKHGVEYPTSSMTWDEFLEKCRALTGDGDYGFATLLLSLTSYPLDRKSVV